MKPHPRNDELLLEHIDECIERIVEFTGGDRATCDASRMVQDAVIPGGSTCHHKCNGVLTLIGFLNRRRDVCTVLQLQQRPVVNFGDFVEATLVRVCLIPRFLRDG